MKTTILLLITGLLTFTHLTTSAQRHEIYNERIATLQVVAGNDWLSPPVTKLHGVPINIGFDDLSHEYHRYTYRIEHCEADWSKSEEIFDSDFIEGFTEGNTIDDSTPTTVYPSPMSTAD